MRKNRNSRINTFSCIKSGFVGIFVDSRSCEGGIMLGRRLISTAIVTLWLVFLLLLSVPIREDVAHSYHQLIGSAGELPSLTREYSLRILGMGNYLSANKDGFFYLFWGILWVVPLLILFFSWTIKEPVRLSEFLLYTWIAYLLLSVFLLVMALYGLLMPFMCI